MTALLEDRFRKTSQQISRLLRYETTPFTQNDHDFTDIKEKLLVLYKELQAMKLQPEDAEPLMQSNCLVPLPIPKAGKKASPPSSIVV